MTEMQVHILKGPGSAPLAELAMTEHCREASSSALPHPLAHFQAGFPC